MPQTTFDATTAVDWQLNADQDGPLIADEGSDVMGVRTALGVLAKLKIADPTEADDAATKNWVETQGALSADAHKALRQLIHFIDSGPAEGFATGAYLEILPGGDPFPTSETWWETAAKLEKIMSVETTYNSNKTVNTETWKMYDTDGSTLLVTVTDTYAYSGVFMTSVTRTIVVP